MLKSITPVNMAVNVNFEDINSCPICNAKISPIYISGKSYSTAFSLFCECTSCGKTFIAYFNKLENKGIGAHTNYLAESIEYLAPIFPKVSTFDERIINLSPNFVEIYHQSQSAEAYKLNQIAGMGYRKALEFLIKDYCVHKDSSNYDKIYGMPLSQCINNYIDDTKIKNLSKVSTWLGNDETHYIRKFEDKDINDLKRFIDTTVYFILYNLNADEANDIVNSQ